MDLTVTVFAAAPGQPGNLSTTIQIPPSLKLLGEKEALPKNAGLFRILTQKDGDKRVIWDRFSIPQINDAKATFDRLVEEGLKPYRVDPNGNKTPEIMQEFDASAEEIIFSPEMALVGG